MTLNAITITQDLINIASVTPRGEPCLDYIAEFLTNLGFRCHRLVFSEPDTADVDNLYAEYGDSGPNLCFAGHVDVVPPGDLSLWSNDPFKGLVDNNILYGRGAVDMKGAVGCYLAALATILKQGPYPHKLSVMITCDEEGVSINGTAKIIQWLKDNNKTIDFCLVGEPTCTNQLGDMIKVGRRGSLTGYLTVQGTQGHVAYPERADNPIPRLMTTLQHLTQELCRDSYAHFDGSNIEITTIDTGNPASNVIPQSTCATFNIRFNPTYTVEALKQWIISICDHYAGKHTLHFSSGSNAFLQQDLQLTQPIQDIVHSVTGQIPILSTSGGTSDARFIHTICPVIECGLVGQTMHQIDEQVPVADLANLTLIYQKIIEWWSTR